MRIVCPNCDTVYEAPASAMSPGRLMRCAKCRAEWAPVPPAPIVHPEPAATVEPAIDDEPGDEVALVRQPASPPGELSSITAGIPPMAAEPVIRAPFPEMPAAHAPPRRAVIAGWAVSFLVLVVAFWLAIAYRHAVMQHWPASARAYRIIGL